MQNYPLATLVGGSGFLGRHTVKALARAGWRIRVLCRDAVAAEFLKTAGSVGQIAIQYADITRPETLQGKFAGSDAVINFVSTMHQSGRQKFGALNVAGARTIAEQARAAGVKRFIHISALGADKATDTQYGATKLAGEKAVREVMPRATILRPGLLIGPEDNFFQRFARLSLISPVLPLIGGGHTKFQPALVTDVAAAIRGALERPESVGQTFELGGPEIFTFRQLLEMMASVTGRNPCLVPVPFWIAAIKGAFFDLVPFITPPITLDQVRLLKHDSVVADNALTFAKLGLTPCAVPAALPSLLSRFIKS